MSTNTQAQARFNAIHEASTRQPRRFERADYNQVSEYFGINTFSFSEMEERLPRPIFKRLMAIIHEGGSLDAELANAVAHAVKEWALARGATHFTHWFQPMTGATAEKHDAFLDVDEAGRAVERLSGGMLLQGEPDASSFPSGGMRTTFEARGYTGWDPSSPMFIRETENGSTLCIPTVFISYHGHALDKKTPLLRSMEAINTQACKLMAAVGEQGVTRVSASLGVEQEYFLVDRAFYALRPDLAVSGRTIVGARPPKGQSLDDHYFGSVPPRVQAYMSEVEQELYKVGVPAKTRHNEVAPSQFELASIYREANVAVDHNQMVMETLRRVALRHGFQVLLHEKPYAGINGSGKHNNWSLGTNLGDNLLEPGDTPQSNLRFLAVLASTLLGVHRYAGVLRASIASYRNDFRLGANEAPPAIISVFLGQTLTKITEAIIAGDVLADDPSTAMIELGVGKLPDLVRDNTDRNRTSPFAFTGNKFEFRAVGSSQNPSVSMTALNTVVAEGIRQLLEWVEEAGGGEAGVLAAVRKAMIESSPTRFDGDGYSQAWVDEAARRGLKNLLKTPEALDELRHDDTRALFVRHSVYTPAELAARVHVREEQYLTAIDIEADAMTDIVENMILPAALAERGELAAALGSLLDLDRRGVPVDTTVETARVIRLGELTRGLSDDMTTLKTTLAAAHEDAHAYARTVAPLLEVIREKVDALEGIVADGRWPLPKYREMLFM